MRATAPPSSSRRRQRQDFVTRTIKKVLDEETTRLENGLTMLATVGATAPFVGLFGTVWGIYHALVAIGMSGAGTLDKVAGPVGEALIMTGLGLAVAIPAVVGYNALDARQPRAGGAARCLRVRAAHLPVAWARRSAHGSRRRRRRAACTSCAARRRGLTAQETRPWPSPPSTAKRRGTPMAEINMVPLIDVMLVLLVIFIVTAPLLTHAVKLDLPRGQSPGQRPEARHASSSRSTPPARASGTASRSTRAEVAQPRLPPRRGSSRRSPRCTCAPTRAWPTATSPRRWPTPRRPA